MASYTGTIAEAPHDVQYGYPSNLSATIANRSTAGVTTPPTEIHFVIPTTQSSRTYVEPAALKINRGSTNKTTTFVDDYYYRIHLDPYTLNLGAIVSPIQEEILVWNSWFITKTCTVINEVNPEEYTLTGSTAPFSLQGLAWEIYTLDVPDVGSLEFTSTITWVFGTETPILTIIGQRVKVFGWEPSLPLRETLSWNTSIMKARDGSEQRMALRWAPRQMYRYSVFIDNEQDQAHMDAVLFRWQKKTWAVPIWSEWTAHTDTIAIDDTVIYLDTTNADYRDDSTAIIWQGPRNYEAVKITTVASDRLNLDVPIRNDWTGLKWIMPMRIANMLSKVSRPAAPDGHGLLTCDFITSDNVRLTGYTPAATYGGLTVVTDSSIEEDQQQADYDNDGKFTDYNLNDFMLYSDSDFNIVVQNHTFRKDGKAECWDFRKFLHSLYGRRETFWIISDRNDIVQQDDIGAADTDFNVDNIGLTDNYGTNTMRTHLAFIFPDGSHIYRQITGVAETDSTTEVISIDSGLGLLVHPGDCEICFLDKCRLTEDEVEIEWQERFNLRCSLNVTKVSQ